MKIIEKTKTTQDEYEYSLFSNSKTKVTLEEYIDIKKSIGNSPYWILKSKINNVILFTENEKGWLIATDRYMIYFLVFESSNFFSIKKLNYWTELYKKGEL